MRKNTLYIISNTVNEDITNQVENKIYEIPTTFKSDEDRQVFIDCTNELIKLNQCEIVTRLTNDLTLDNISTLFKNITPSFLNIKCQDNISTEGSGKVLIIMLTNEDVNALTGSPSSNGYGWYLKAQFSPKTNSIYDKNGVDENNGIVSIDCIKLIIKFISAKNGNKAIYNDHHMIIDTDKSGLNFVVKVKFADAIKNASGPHILINYNNSYIPYYISAEYPYFLNKVNISPTDAKLLRAWSIKNYNVLLKYLQGKITDRTVLNSIKKVKKKLKSNSKKNSK